MTRIACSTEGCAWIGVLELGRANVRNELLGLRTLAKRGSASVLEAAELVSISRLVGARFRAARPVLGSSEGRGKHDVSDYGLVGKDIATGL